MFAAGLPVCRHSPGLPSCPVKILCRVFKNPRGTVPSTGGRTIIRLEKVDERYGFIFGWSCMSCRQPGKKEADGSQQEQEQNSI